MKISRGVRKWTKTLIIILVYVIVVNALVAVYIGYINNQLTFDLKDISNYIKEKIFVSTPDLNVGMQAENFLQQTSYTCGPAALRYLLYSRFKVEVTEEKLAGLMETTPEGTSLAGMMFALEQLGLQGRGSRVNYSMLDKIPKPVIAFINDFHYIVIIKTEDQYVYAFDPNPGYGHMKAAKDNFLKVWDGIILQVTAQELTSKQGGDGKGGTFQKNSSLLN